MKLAVIGGLALLGLMVLSEWLMPGHWDRLTTYFQGNLDALLGRVGA